MKKLVILFAVFLFCGIVSATNVANCSGLTDSTVYTLTGLATNTSGTCFEVLQENLTLDCQGNWIVFGGTDNAQYGIDNSGGYRNITIKNCRINQTSGETNAAIYFENAANGTVYNNTIEISSNYGVAYISGINANISSNYLTSSSDDAGIFMSLSPFNYLNFNNINFSAGNGDGIKFDSNVNWTRLEGNIINSSAGRGMMMQSVSYHNKIYHNNISSRSNSAIEVTNCYNASVKENIVEAFDSDTYGIAIESSTNFSDIINNTATTFGVDGYGIYLANSFDAVVRNNSINATETYGVYVSGSNVQEYNHSITDNMEEGKSIYYYYFNDSAVLNAIESSLVIFAYSNNILINASNITCDGILLAHTQNSTISNCNISSIQETGIYFESENYFNTITNNMFLNFLVATYGILLYDNSNNNTVSFNTLIPSNDLTGAIFLVNALNNTAVSNVITSSGTLSYGFVFLTAGNSTITNNTMTFSDSDSIPVLAIESTENLFYNNIFNTSLSTSPFFFYYNESNSFNTTKTLSTNIIGKNYVGGNFYTNMSGTGYSDTCTNTNDDYICDSSYNLLGATNSTSPLFDFLPLTLRTNTSTVYYDDSGGGGSPSSSNAVSEKNQIISKVTPDKPAIIKDFKEDSSIEEIEIEVTESVEDIKVSVTSYSSTPSSVSDKGGKVYNYLKIDTQNLADKLKKARLTVKVPNSWLEEESLEKEDIAVFRFEEEWNELGTQYKNTVGDYHYYDVELTEFSYFAIAEKTEETKKTKLEEMIKESFSAGKYIAFIVAIVIIVLIYVLGKNKISRLIDKISNKYSI